MGRITVTPERFDMEENPWADGPFDLLDALAIIVVVAVVLIIIVRW
jgi:hypothetical protein